MVDTQKGLNYGLQTGIKSKNFGPVSKGEYVVTLEN
jgi:hypothetical protein